MSTPKEVMKKLTAQNEPGLHDVTDPKQVQQMFRELQFDQAVRNEARITNMSEQSGFVGDMVDSWFLDTTVGRISTDMASRLGQQSPYEDGKRKKHIPFGTFNPYEQDLKGYENYLEEFQGAYSPTEFARIKGLIDKNRARRDRLEHNDVFWTRMLASVFDPVNLVAAPAVRGMGFFKAMQAGAGRNLLAVGAGEVLTAPLDPTQQGEETFMNVATGFGFASAFSGVAGLFKGSLGADAASRAQARYDRAFQETQQGADPAVSRKAMEAAARPSRTEYETGVLARETGLSYEDWLRRDHVPDSLPKTDVRFAGLKGTDSYVLRAGDDGTVIRYKWSRKGGLVEDKTFPDMAAANRSIRTTTHRKVDSFNTVHAVTWRRTDKSILETPKKKLDDEPVTARDQDGVEIRDNDPVDQAHFRHIEIERDINAYQKAARELGEEADGFQAQADTLAARLKEKEAAVSAAERAGDTKKAAANRGVITREKLVARLAEVGRKVKEKRYQQNQAESRVSDALERKKLVEETGDPDYWDMPGGAAFQLLTEGFGKTNQFGWWRLIKNKLRDKAPRTASMFQRTAWAMSSSPGVHSRAGSEGASMGGSVEALAKAWHGMFAQVQHHTDAAYAKYAGWGDDLSTTQVWGMAQRQRAGQVVADIKGKVTGKPAERPDGGIISLGEFRAGVGRILMGQPHKVLQMDFDEAALKQMTGAANKWRELTKEFEKQGKELGLFPTKEGVQERIFKTEARIAEIGEKLAGIKAHREKVKKNRSLESKMTEDRQTGEYRNWRSVEELDEIIGRMEKQIGRMEDTITDSKEVLDLIKDTKIEDENFFYRMWDREAVQKNGDALKEKLRTHFTNKPFVLMGGRRVKLSTDPRDIDARVEEAYDQILGESEFGDSIGLHTVFGSNKHDKLKRKADGMAEREKELTARQKEFEEGTEGWELLQNELEVLSRRRQGVEKDISKGTMSDSGGPGTFLHRKIDIPNSEVAEFIEQDVVSVMQQYTHRVAPMIEMARRFGDARLDDHLLYLELNGLREILELGPKNAEASLKELDILLDNVRVQRDITLGNYGIPDDPSALTNRATRLALTISTMSLMGRSVQMALTDISKAVVSRGLIKGFGDLFSYMSSVADESSRWGLGARETRLAGEALERVNATRLMQMHEVGGTNAFMSKFERKMFGEQGRFFMFNGMALWTDHAKQFAGTIAQSEIIRVAYKVVDGTATKKELAAISGAIDKDMAKRIVKQHQALPADEQKLGSMFVANTEAWTDPAVKRAFRAQLVDEVNRTVFTPGAVDKPKLMSTNMGRMIGQYHAFSFATTNRLMAPALQTPDRKHFNIIMSMVAAGFLVDLMRSKDFGEMSVEDRIFRAVELSGVTGIFGDLNNMVEGASGHQLGLRASMGLQQPFNNSNWATKVGAVAGAAPSQYLNLAHAMFDDEATGQDQARAARYLIPYNNMIWWNDMAGRVQREAGRALEDE